MKTPLVLLPGLLSDETLWLHQKRHLNCPAAIQIISSYKNTPMKMVQAILDAAPSTFALAGHSMGGWLCLEVVKMAPSRIIKLCLLNTTARADSEEKRIRREEMILKAEKGEFPALAKEMAEQFVSWPEVRAKVENMFLLAGKDVFINQERAMLSRSECSSILPGITCPTLVIHAAQDKVFSLEEHRELADNIPGAKLAVVEDSGHMSPMEMPQAITSLLNFWLTYF